MHTYTRIYIHTYNMYIYIYIYTYIYIIARCWLLFIPYHFLTISTKPPTYSPYFGYSRYSRYSLTSLTQPTIHTHTHTHTHTNTHTHVYICILCAQECTEEATSAQALPSSSAARDTHEHDTKTPTSSAHQLRSAEPAPHARAASKKHFRLLVCVVKRGFRG